MPSSGQAQEHSQPTAGGSAANEITPIVSHASSQKTQRRYSSTEEVLRARSSESGSGHGPGAAEFAPAQGHDGRNGNQARQPQGPRSRSSEGSDEQDHEAHAPWYSRIADKYGSLELENKGSVARDHLALERTFLAWLRTSLAFASIGIAVTQLFRLSNTRTESANFSGLTSQTAPFLLPVNNNDGATIMKPTDTSDRLRSLGKPLGTTFIGVAILILLVGFHRYFESQYWIIRGKFPASRGSVALIAFVAGALIVAALAVILAISPSAVET
ncbi:hypothetical protein BDV18DRAFT_118376 [Aspergillus unguis]